MDLYLNDQSTHFGAHLARLSNMPVMGYDPAQLKHSITSVVVAAPFKVIDFSFFFDYQLFPFAIMTSYAQWTAEGRAMAEGDCIVQQIQIPPVTLAPRIIMGVRIKEVIAQPKRIGYSYETLAGHVERGISAFLIEEIAGDRIKFTIETWSVSSLVIGRLLAPVFTLPYQRFCTRKALKNVEARILNQL